MAKNIGICIRKNKIRMCSKMELNEGKYFVTNQLEWEKDTLDKRRR